MNDSLADLAPGLLLALAPALVIIAAEAVRNGRHRRSQSRAERIQHVLDFTGQARAIVLTVLFTQAHAHATTRLTGSLAVLWGQLQPLDLAEISRTYRSDFTALLRWASHIRATEPDEITDLVEAVEAATFAVFNAYLTPADHRASLMIRRSDYPPPDPARAKQLMA